MRRLYIQLVLASAVIVTTLIAVGTGVYAGDPFNDPVQDKREYLAVAFAPSLIKYPTASAKNPYPEAADVLSTTLADAKKQALAKCEDQGVARERYYKDDCQGAVWVRNGWVALAEEPLAPKGADVPYSYKYAYGGAYAETRNKAVGKAVDICFKKDPKYRDCEVVEAWSTDAPFNPHAHQGGAW
jgi:Domain of unknown function (DUF4189)